MIEELIRAAAAGDDDALEELIEIAAAEPARLVGHLSLLLDAGVLWPPTLYRGATGDVVRRIIDDVDAGRAPHRLNHLLLILAHASDPRAEQALRRWQEQPPAGADKLHVGALAYARQAGWTVAPDGSRRELCTPTAYRLIPNEVPRPADGPACPWCASPLWTIADLDTGTPEVGEVLAHTGWAGRLRIVTCHLCACYAALCCEVTPDGEAVWWAGNSRPDYAPVANGPEEPPAVLPVVGPRRASPFEASAWDEGGSTLGGHPDWIQDAEHVDCPTCRQPMDYLGLVGGADVDFGEGAYYLHLHAPCGVAAVNYQQS
ncbi:hypothetical protein V6U77_11295 [Micromonospora sp. CPCC 205546]|uniref:hypothetical protein n=1 Tax=Micromonospora sp. CPCC 205546 TaxID=3122397 RepID=UPI002FF4295C